MNARILAALEMSQCHRDTWMRILGTISAAFGHGQQGLEPNHSGHGSWNARE